jgi:GcrA cell cycle regulator
MQTLGEETAMIQSRYTTKWTDEMIRTLERLWNEGKTASQVGLVFGVSRNAIIGKLHRLGLSQDTRTVKSNYTVCAKPKVKLGRPAKPKVEKKPKPIKVRALPPPPLPTPAPPPKRLDGHCIITEMTGCKWPVGFDEDGRHLFCNAKRPSQDRPYCIPHAQQSYAGFKKENVDAQFRLLPIGLSSSGY